MRNSSAAKSLRESELKTAEQLNVPLPADNVDFHRLAESLASKLPRDAALPTDKRAAEGWQQQKRERLKALLRVPNYQATALDDKHERRGRVSRHVAAISVWRELDRAGRRS